MYLHNEHRFRHWAEILEVQDVNGSISEHHPGSGTGWNTWITNMNLMIYTCLYGIFLNSQHNLKAEPIL